MNTLVTEANIASIALRLLQKEGYILMGGPGSGSYGGDRIVDIDLHLYHHPLIDLEDQKGPAISTKRGTVMKGGQAWQTEWEHDRLYMLRPLQEIEYFSHMKVAETHSFQIRLQSTTGQGFYFSGNHCAIFIPHDNGNIGEAIRQALTLTTKNVHSLKVSPCGIQMMTKYAVDDFATNEVFMDNVRAGIDYDV